VLSHRERNALYRTTSTRLPLVLVVASLAIALLVPRLAQRRVNRLRDDINLFADPARTDVAAIELDLALEAAARRGYALTGDAQLAREITVWLSDPDFGELLYINGAYEPRGPEGDGAGVHRLP